MSNSSRAAPVKECKLEARNLVGLPFFPLHPKKEAPPSRARLPRRLSSVARNWSLLLNGSCRALAQKCAHSRPNPANMAKKLVLFVGSQLDHDPYCEANFVVRVRHSKSWTFPPADQPGIVLSTPPAWVSVVHLDAERGPARSKASRRRHRRMAGDGGLSTKDNRTIENTAVVTLPPASMARHLLSRISRLRTLAGRPRTFHHAAPTSSDRPSYRQCVIRHGRLHTKTYCGRRSRRRKTRTFALSQANDSEGDHEAICRSGRLSKRDLGVRGRRVRARGLRRKGGVGSRCIGVRAAQTCTSGGTTMTLYRRAV
jgi:hypothetical protein